MKINNVFLSMIKFIEFFVSIFQEERILIPWN
jgi:hypothetical protein